MPQNLEWQQRTDKRLTRLEQEFNRRKNKLDQIALENKQITRHLNRLEEGIFKEFKISQEIMLSMINHDHSIEKAKVDLKLEMERKEKEWARQREQAKAQEKEARRALRVQIYKQVGLIGLPVMTALATLIATLIETYLK